jgi:tetratricopeptide (TPR) repeat protein
VPAWNTLTREWVREGRLVVIRIAQEQHADRCRLFAQWHHLDWPILYDPINVMGVRGVPIEVAIDEHGIVRNLRPERQTFEKEFLDREFSTGSLEPPDGGGKAVRPDAAVLRRRAEQEQSAEAWRRLGDALVLWEGPGRIEAALDAYRQALRVKPDDGDAHFRLGVCYRARYESPQAQPNDFQAAVDEWTRARQLEPNQYIWRRRIEQYGPRLTKPYPFYDWVETATKDIRTRGEQPVELRVLPTGSEIAGPAPSFDIAERVEPPDPRGRIQRDEQGLILTEVAVVPPHVPPGGTVRVHVTFRPNQSRAAHWDNETEPLKVWVEPPFRWKAQPQLLAAAQDSRPQSSEPRHLEFELQAPAEASGVVTLAAYALYHVCEDTTGTCSFLRQDIPLAVKISK